MTSTAVRVTALAVCAVACAVACTDASLPGPGTAGGGSAGGNATGGVVTTGSTGGSAGVSAGVGGAGGVGGANASGGAAAGGVSAGGAAAGSGGIAGASGAGGASAGAGGASAGAGGASAGAGGTGGVGGGGDSDLLVPAQGALLGAFVGTGTFAQFETLLGRNVPIVHNFFAWSNDWVARVESDVQSGRIPLITWEPWTATLDDIINGVHDSLIQSRAEAAKDVGQKFFLRWGHEMNGNWYPWDGSANGAGPSATAKYIAAYRHIHDIFDDAGADNVLWVFCPNFGSVPGDSWNAWTNYYPGDAYVDWVGFDGYNWGTTQAGSSWQAFSSIVGSIYPSMAALGKPIMIAETASTEQGGNKADWIEAVLPALQSSPQVKALVWFEMNKETDWRVESSAASQQSFIAFANDPYMNP